MAAFKTGSGELTNLPLLEHLAAKRKPIIVSTGMATLEEVATAVSDRARPGAAGPAPLRVGLSGARRRETNLRAMDTLRERFGCPGGLLRSHAGL